MENVEIPLGVKSREREWKFMNRVAKILLRILYESRCLMKSNKQKCNIVIKMDQLHGYIEKDKTWRASKPIDIQIKISYQSKAFAGFQRIKLPPTTSRSE